jgi:hypothetical protein
VDPRGPEGTSSTDSKTGGLARSRREKLSMLSAAIPDLYESKAIDQKRPQRPPVRPTLLDLYGVLCRPLYFETPPSTSQISTRQLQRLQERDIHRDFHRGVQKDLFIYQSVLTATQYCFDHCLFIKA